MSNGKITAIVLALITTAGIGLHLYRIGWPAQPVFDEAHFATYAADYATGHTFEDIHPPLGKLIYAATLETALRFASPAERDTAVADDHTQFITFIVATGTDAGIIAVPGNPNYDTYPYVMLRIVSALFGILLPLALYAFLRNIGAGRFAATIAAFALAFDNAFLIATRLILMDGMFIFFDLAALALYFYKGPLDNPAGRHKPHRFAIAAGLIWGLALSVKLTAIVFIGPPIIALVLAFRAAFFNCTELRALFRFVAVGFATLAAIFFAGTFIFSPSARIASLAQFNIIEPGSILTSPTWQSTHPAAAYITATVGEIRFMLSGYTSGNSADGESPWYFWPAMQLPILYYQSPTAPSGGQILFSGNPADWLLGTLAVVVALACSFRWFKEYVPPNPEDTRRDAALMLLGSYLITLFPFMLFVHRSTYLYHYLPSLLFSFGLLGWFAAGILGVRDWTDLTVKKSAAAIILLLIIVAGFFSAGSGTYGL